jgi:hypothetical protein
MITQLSTVKARLGIDEFEVKYDGLLTNAIKAVGARFDKVCNRTLARTVAATQEFDGNESEIVAVCYPIEAVSKFELKENETDGWVEQTGVDYLLRRGCVISLGVRLGTGRELGRVTYTGGYVLPAQQWEPARLRCRMIWSRRPWNRSPRGFKIGISWVW